MEAQRGNSTNYPLAAKNWSGSNPRSRAELMKPYAIMRDALAAQNRDIVFSLCQYGMGNVWEWGDQVGGNCWRTTGDIRDTWNSMSGIGFHQDKAAPFAKPGNWNDPDMLVVGEVGWGKTHPSHLTPDEQYAHISLWCLLAAPLLIGCDMTKLDDFTLNLLENDEVLALDQDALGNQATCAFKEGELHIYKKALEDGGHVLGFFNLGAEAMDLQFGEFGRFGFAGQLHVRDLWRQKDLAELNAATGSLELKIPPHGVALYKFTAQN
jgi:alpha-galactosidase